MANKKKKTISSAKKNKPVKKASAPAEKKKQAKPARQAVAKKATAKKSIAKKPTTKKSTAKKSTAKKVVKKTKTSTKVKTKSSVKHQVAKSKVTKKPVAIRPVAVSVKKVEKIDYSKAITPLGDRLVVRVANGGERVTAGGLIIPDTVSQATGYLKAQVLAVGSGAKSKKGHLKPLDVKIGDEVLFSEYAGTKIKFGQEEVQIIHESDVMGVVQK